MKKIALITALVIGTGSVAMAEDGFDPNLANRYPAYAAPHAQQGPAFTSRSVSLNGGQAVINQTQAFDRAGSLLPGGDVR